MDFNIADLHKREEVLRSSLDQILKTVNNAKNAVKTENIEELNHAALMRLNKDVQANFVENLSKSLISNIDYANPQPVPSIMSIQN